MGLPVKEGRDVLSLTDSTEWFEDGETTIISEW